MLNKQGYTLIESLLVLFVISMLLLVFPFIAYQNKSSLNIQMNTIHAFLLQTQALAMKDKVVKEVNSGGNNISSTDQSLRLIRGMNCNNTNIVFHPNGNVQKAQTIRCSINNAKRELVVLLGSGRMYVK